jgi:hypothetical protein
LARKRFQNKVATSSFTLPVAALIATLSALAQCTANFSFWLGFACYVLIAYLMVELNNANALLRIRSRLTTSLFLLFLAGCPFLIPLQAGAVVALCVIAAYHLFFQSYQQNHAEGLTFYAFCCIGIGTLFFPQLFYLVPFYFLSMAVQLRTFTPRSFLAGLLGLSMPYWFVFGYVVLTHQSMGTFVHFNQLTQLFPIDRTAYLKLGVNRIASFAALSWISIVGLIHYRRNGFYDKIRVRMLFNFIMVQEIVLFILLALQPQHFDVLFVLLLLNSSPLMSHFFALTNRMLTNLAFIVTLLLIAGLIVFSIWNP